MLWSEEAYRDQILLSTNNLKLFLDCRRFLIPGRNQLSSNKMLLTLFICFLSFFLSFNFFFFEGCGSLRNFSNGQV